MPTPPHDTTLIDSPDLSTTELPTRRARREARRNAAATDTVQRRSIPRSTARPSPRTAPPSAFHRSEPARWKQLRSTIVIGLIVPAVCAAFALPVAFGDPGYAAPDDTSAPHPVQSLTVSGDVTTEPMSRSGYSATSQSELDAAAAARAAAAQEAARATESAAEQTGSGSGAQSSVDLAAVFAKAKQYQGVPYVFGGATPAGFDCSGFVMYVYGQFGISLPHSVTGQAAAGTRIPLSEAQPGDLVIMNGHDGFYAGNGMILDAPKPGGQVSIRSIWTSDYSIVRITG